MTAIRDLSELVAKDSVDILDYMGWENIKCRVSTFGEMWSGYQNVG